ncbi:SDR family NAD(P)-dependent oxidoreductase [Dactylosporangium sp. CA-092794]|uniref:SDR family NAD(P)-dependent oxidoreductase n=1 Tax=Dactylosporangium sp. CA-092794 TaxID=3239929 RepID=UPI003D8E0D8A
MSRLAHRTALVTGSTSGIGRAIAERFAAEGAHVIVSGRRAEFGAAVVQAIADAGGRATFIAADLSAGRAAIEDFAAAVGEIDILVNNAAYLVGGRPTADTPEDVVDAALATNIKAPYLLTAALAPKMLARGTGAIVNIGSINALTGMAGSALYGATKAALHAMTVAWAAEFGPYGIRVNTIAPGPTVVEWAADRLPMLERLVAGVPSRRMSRAEEIAAAALFLASDEASHIHGATLPVDGGLTAATSHASARTSA